MSKQSVDAVRTLLESLPRRDMLAVIRDVTPAPATVTIARNDTLLLKQADAGRMVGCSRHTIRRLVEDGLLHPVKLRGATRYRRSELLALAGEGRAA